jgi:uracil phosphoribosyltransferase
MERIGEIMAYEISKSMHYTPEDVKTPLGIAPTNVIDEKIVISTILRAGLPFHTGFLSYFDKAENAFVSAYRKYKDALKFDIFIEYIASPDLTGKTLIITDPMLATGGSMVATIDMLKKHGCQNIKALVLVATPEGVKAVNDAHPDIKIFTAALDSHLNEHGYIIPGLGDAGDKIFGTKQN